MDVRLIVWGVFGGLGFAFFFMLIELLRRFNHNSTAKESLAAHGSLDHINNINNVEPLSQAQAAQLQSSSTTPSFCFPSSLLPILRDFSYQQLQLATNGFAQESLLKEAPFGKLYSGSLKDHPGGISVVIKCLDSREVYNHELQMLAALSRQNNKRLVELIGMCTEERILVFRQLPNGDLASALRRGEEFKSSDGDSESSDSSTGSSKPLDWITRFKIANGLAEALAFLHHECSPPVIHRDVNSSSVLLDEAYEVRLGSFTKSCIQQGGGDVFPVYDIYCFGKVLLDLISGLDVSGGGDGFAEAWLHKAMPLMEFSRQEEFLRLVDPMLVIDEDHVKELMLLAVIARSCLDPQQVQHQSMSNIHQMLQNPAFFLAVAGH